MESDDSLNEKLEVARMLERLEHECKGNGTGVIATLVRAYGWKFEMTISDTGIFLGVIGNPTR